ncbi:MAG: replication initiation protein [Bifidobacterium sp.]|jgi:plasmid replication initiation protein|uniref:replication initiation protein n=1 Tax=Bifidobacterium TaxID=1678 RepID=UPI0018C33BD1|nr:MULTISPECIES: replication initiation protein [Bifidobacterium]MBF9717284.1 replication initiation protein [Bifidobacterium dentium]MDU5322957.1 replication initiation protein [Bifidobacterium sp.]MDU5888269.1 replication initiation protein [Bifidobacterium scardovii]
MANEIVKYDNQFNNQVLRKFTPLEIDLLMTVCSGLRDHGTTEESFPFDELKRQMNLEKNLTNIQFANLLVSMNRRLLALNFEFTDGRGAIHQFALFSDFVTDPSSQTLTAAVNAKFSFLLNDLTSGFTRFELEQFTSLRSSYAKECYRRLKQYRQTGVWKVSLAEFRRLLDIPDSYRTSHINSRVIKPIEDELGPLMNLKVHRKFAKVAAGRGRSQLVGFEFEFDPERVPGGRGAPRVDLSWSVREDAARRSLESVTPRLVEVRGWGEVWWTGDFDMAAARGHLDGSLPAERCVACRMDARNVAGHGSASNSLVDVPLFD